MSGTEWRGSDPPHHVTTKFTQLEAARKAIYLINDAAQFPGSSWRPTWFENSEVAWVIASKVGGVAHYRQVHADRATAVDAYLD